MGFFDKIGGAVGTVGGFASPVGWLGGAAGGFAAGSAADKALGFANGPGDDQFGPNGAMLRRRMELAKGMTDSNAARMKAIDARQVKPLGMEQGGYKANVQNNPAYAALRQNLQSQAQRNAQMATDAVQRRFAAMGGMGGGAEIKATQQAHNDANEQSNAQLAQMDMQLAQREGDKEFQSQEAMTARNAGREQFNASQDFQDAVFKLDAYSKLKQLDIGAEQLVSEAEDNDYTKQMNQLQYKRSGGLMGKGGFLGLGLGV